MSSPDPIDSRMQTVEEKVAIIDKRTALIDERQARLHDDFHQLTQEVSRLNVNLTSLNKIFENKRGFVAGALATISVIGAAVGAAITFLWDKLSG